MTKSAKIADILNKVRDGLFTTDRTGVITFANEPLARMHGLDGPEEMIGKHFSEFVSPEFRTEISKKFKKAVKRGSYSEDVEFCTVRKDGGLIFIQLKHGPLTENGQIVGTAGVIRDVTDGKRVVQALTASEKKYRAIVENMSDVVFIVDQTGRLLFITPSVKSLVGYEQSEIIGHNIQEFIYEKDLDPALNNIRHVISEEGRTTSNEYRLLHKNGRIIWMQTFTRPFFEGDDVVAVQGSFRDITERKKADEALMASEKKCRDLITNMKEVLYTLDRNSRITFVSPSVESMIQYRDSEITGHNMEEFISRDDVPRFIQDHQNCLSGISKGENEYRMVTKSGEIRWGRTRCNPLYEEAEIIGVQGILSDITTYKRSEEDARAAQAMQQLIMNNVPQGIFWKDRRSTYLGCNSVFAKAVGLKSTGSIVGKTDYDLSWTREQAESFREYDRRIMDNDAPEYHIAEQMQEVDGRQAWVESNKVPLHDAQGNVIGILGTYEDITERKRVEEALRESEEKFRSLVETTNDWIWEVDADAIYTYASPQVRDLLGYEPEEVIGRKPFDFMPPEEAAYIREEFSAIAKDRKAFSGLENVNIAKDGRRVVLETSGVPRLDTLGNLMGYRGIDRDITNRKHAEEVLRMSRDELELRVRERTVELERRARQLARLSSELTLAEQRERRRLAEVLHDHLQQFLIAAKMNSEVLFAKSDAEQKQSAANILNLISQSLQTSRILTTELSPPVLQQGSLSEAIEWLCRWMQENHGLIVELQADHDLDPGQQDMTLLLFQSIRELLLNVVKHAGVKSAEIDMSRDEQGRLRVTVTDQGSGLDPDTIWEEADGSKFGLLTIRERLELMGGSFEIRSSLGKGASFELVVPLETTKDIDEKRIHKIMAKVQRAKTSGEKIRVLLVDDHTVVRQGLSTMLNLHADVEVVGEAADGAEAVGKARTLQPDVILMDISMPRMDGLEATRIIHSDFPDIRIVGLSMHDKQDKAAQMVEAGASSYCTKDGATDVLLSAIRGL